MARTRQMGVGVGMAFVVGVVVFGGVLLMMRGGTGRTKVVPVRERPTASKLAYGKLEGGVWRLEERRGKVVVVNYFATWCGPCVREMPGLGRVAGAFKEKGVEVVGVSLDLGGEGRSREEVVRKFVKERGVGLEVLMPAVDSPLFMGEVAVPQTFVFDKAGRQAWAAMGEVGEGELRGVVEGLLGE